MGRFKAGNMVFYRILVMNQLFSEKMKNFGNFHRVPGGGHGENEKIFDPNFKIFDPQKGKNMELRPI